MNGKISPVLIHVLGCLLFLALPIVFAPESTRLSVTLLNPPTQRDFLSYVLLIGVFYANYLLLIPRLYFKRRWAVFVAINAAAFAIIVFLPNAVVPQDMAARQETMPPQSRPPLDDAPRERGGPQTGDVSHGPGGPPPGEVPHGAQQGPRGPGGPMRQPMWTAAVSHHLFLFLGVVFFALALQLSDRWKQTEREKLQAELAYLKAQVNPHFLFNTLNGIYALALEKSDRAPGAVARLAAMMRYVLHEAGRERVPLEREIAYIQDYIALQEVRFDGGAALELTVTGNAAGKTIAPLVLMPFVENAFKHGVNAEEDSRIGVRIDIGRDDLRLEVVNKKVTVQLGEAEQSGIGIQNTRERLHLLYPGTHTLEIHNNPLDFMVMLWLKLQ